MLANLKSYCFFMDERMNKHIFGAEWFNIILGLKDKYFVSMIVFFTSDEKSMLEVAFVIFDW